MSTIETTKMSSKGQVVIPENIRKKLGLKAGSQFIVVGDKDVVILKSIEPPSMQDFDEMITKARTRARQAGLKKSEIQEAIKKARG
jgi:AbrB family looped-hinge helix DNA binding protein